MPIIRSDRGRSYCSACAGAARKMAAESGQRQMDPSFRTDRTGSRQRAANVRTTATPTPDGLGLSFERQQALDHQWRHRAGAHGDGPTSCVLAARRRRSRRVRSVTPDMPGFEVVEVRMPKCGVRGTATSRLAFHDMFVPSENVLGPLGKGLKGGGSTVLSTSAYDVRRHLHRRRSSASPRASLTRRHARQFEQPIGSV